MLALLALLAGCRITVEPREPPSPVLRGAPAESARHAAEARKHEARFRSGGPDALEACAEAARCRAAAGDHDRALALVGEGLERWPGHPDLLQVRANVLERLGFRRAAEACYGEVLEADAGRTAARLARARLRLELGLARIAREDLERCFAEGEDSGEAWIAYARALCAGGEARPAFEAFERGFERGAGDARCLLAAAEMVLAGELPAPQPGDAERAELWTRRSLELAPGWPPALYALARLRLERGDLEGARVHLERVVQLERTHAEALARLAEVCALLGDERGATEAARQALEHDLDGDQRARLEALLERHGRLARQGRGHVSP